VSCLPLLGRQRGPSFRKAEVEAQGSAALRYTSRTAPAVFVCPHLGTLAPAAVVTGRVALRPQLAACPPPPQGLERVRFSPPETACGNVAVLAWMGLQ